MYLFLSLMLSYLNSGGERIEDHTADRKNYDNLIEFLEHKDPAPHLPLPFSLFYNKELPKGRDFLRFCKFGTMQVVLLHQQHFSFWKNSSDIMAASRTPIDVELRVPYSHCLLHLCTVLSDPPSHYFDGYSSRPPWPVSRGRL